MGDASLLVSGSAYLGWTSVAVTRSMEQLASTFEVSFVEQWSGQDLPIPLIEGVPCLVKLNTTPVVNGYVDDVTIDYDDRSHGMSVSGRSRTGDLVDCSALYTLGKGQWRNQPLIQIATDLCQPFGITVSVQTDLGAPFRRFTLQDGETVHEALERAARMRGVLMMTDGTGALVFTRATAAARTRTAVERGVNVLRGRRTGSWRDRFSQYTVKTQVAGDDNFFGGSAATPKRVCSDADVNRYRPLILQAEGQESGAELQKRADWERNVRAGRAQRLSYTVDGWSNQEGLWQPNVLARVVDPALKVNAELLILSVRQVKNAEDGSVTELELADPKVMTVEPLTPKPNRSSSFL